MVPILSTNDVFEEKPTDSLPESPAESPVGSLGNTPHMPEVNFPLSFKKKAFLRTQSDAQPEKDKTQD